MYQMAEGNVIFLGFVHSFMQENDNGHRKGHRLRLVSKHANKWDFVSLSGLHLSVLQI